MRSLFVPAGPGLGLFGPRSRIVRLHLLSAILGLAGLALWSGKAAADDQKPMAATLLVRLPADAQLTIEGQATLSTSAMRRFVTPPIEPGKKYSYVVQAKWKRGSTTVTVEEVVPVQAGQETMVNLGFGQSSVRIVAAGSALDRGTSEVYAPASAYGYGPYSTFSPPIRSPRVRSLSAQDPLRGIPAYQLRDVSAPR